MDLKNMLKEEEGGGDIGINVPQQVNDTDIRIHKKPMQLRDIENRSASKKVGGPLYETKETIKDLINEEKINSYKKPWNKLDLGLKLNRLKNYVEKEAIEKGLDDGQKSELEKILLLACRAGKLNKNSDIEYDSSVGDITKIKILKYVDDKYFLTIQEVKKSKSGSKSKSNIDRLLKGNSK
tara:strand:+ start:3547 stop:4089 length:543 start_codon:yes stop_codon:yes gene_type:complete